MIKRLYNMKTINEYISESTIVNEGKEVEYSVSFLDPKGKDELPFTVRIFVEKENQAAFEDFLEKQQDNIFIHAEGGDVEY